MGTTLLRSLYAGTTTDSSGMRSRRGRQSIGARGHQIGVAAAGIPRDEVRLVLESPQLAFAGQLEQLEAFGLKLIQKVEWPCARALQAERPEFQQHNEATGAAQYPLHAAQHLSFESLHVDLDQIRAQ